MQKINQFHCSVESLFMEDNLNRQYDENKRRNIVQKNLKYTLGSFYFVGNKFLDCQLFNDVISLFHLCAPFKKTFGISWEY